ncbi:hypothetical protein ANN_13308 [Periplaneta americana]|uniref:Major facilitator superfamily (MFS) profile domain-containing protein n=1 Tax=Periplaneta americana TaxID=6978 RepID=A0ABQ8TL35_PERAM|nr:hypothetical protein ANN_13308 [Periplaneta americana]
MLICVDFGFLVYSMGLSHTAVLIPRLKEENNTFTFNDQQAAYIASVYSIVSPVGYVLGGTITDFCGRRRTIILGHICYIVGWIAIAAAQNISTILVGRIIEGVAKGLTAITGFVYTDEMSDPRLRGAFSISMKISVLLGILLILGLGTFLHWRTATAIALSGDIVALLGFVFYMPETPSWLVRKGRLRDAHASLTKLWGPGHETQSIADRPREGRPRKTTPGQDRYVRLSARRNPIASATTLRHDLREATGVVVSSQTVRNRPHDIGLYARRPLKTPALRPHHRCARA